MKISHYVITGAITYLLFLFISVPATTIHFISDQLPQVKIQGVAGTLWNGRAQRVIIASQYPLNDVNWSFCAWRLITGELCLELDASYQNSPFYGQIGTTLAGSLKLRDLSAESSAEIMGKLLQLPIGELSGTVSIDMASARWNRGSAPMADGTITWENAAITVAETATLGTVSIIFSESDEHPLIATINNKGGDIALKGHASIIDDGTYNLELNLTPGNKASRNIQSSLNMFAKKQPDGSFILNYSGNLEQFGLM